MRTAAAPARGPIMVMRRVSRFEEGPPKRALAIFRRTPLQALGQGLRAGAVGGMILVLVSVIATSVRLLVGGHMPPRPVTWAIVAFAVPVVVGAVAGLAIGVRVGVDVDDSGVWARPAVHQARWLDIVDIRAERRRARTVVVVYLAGGQLIRLLAPYDGGVLSHDPNFERKYFRLLNLWETHRNWRNVP